MLKLDTIRKKKECQVDILGPAWVSSGVDVLVSLVVDFRVGVGPVADQVGGVVVHTQKVIGT